MIVERVLTGAVTQRASFAAFRSSKQALLPPRSLSRRLFAFAAARALTCWQVVFRFFRHVRPLAQQQAFTLLKTLNPF